MKKSIYSKNETVASDLLHALVTMNVPAARLAFDRGADPKMRDVDYPRAWQWIRRNPEGASLIQDAVLLSGERQGNGNRMDMIDLFIEKGCPIGGSNHEGYSALHNAALINHTPAAKRLVELGHSVDVQSLKGFTPLQVAVKYENNEVVSFLLAKDAKSSIQNHRMEDASAYAERHNNKEAQAIVQSAKARNAALSVLDEIDFSSNNACQLFLLQSSSRPSKAKKTRPR